MAWRKTTLGNFISLQRGHDLTEQQRQAGDIPVLGSAGVNGFHNVAKAKGPGVVIGRSGASFGKAHYTPYAYWPHNTVLYVNDFKNNHPRFVYYLLDSINFASFNSGSAQPSLNRNYIYGIEIKIPNISEQTKIASIISAYDDLIENNLRRIRILEDIAQNIYNEWFVSFRFPDHSHIRFVDSPMGEIPCGWEVKPIGEIFQTVLGGTPSRRVPEYWMGGTIPWINSGKVNDLRIIDPSELITPLALKESAAKIMPVGTTVLAITGATLGQVSFLEIETSANQSVVGIIDLTGTRSEWLYLAINAQIHSIINKASGGAQQHINKDIVNDFLLVIPDTSIAKNFQLIIQPIFRQIASLLRKNKLLRKMRDNLLPKLINGELDVADLDIAIPEEIAT